LLFAEGVLMVVETVANWEAMGDWEATGVVLEVVETTAAARAAVVRVAVATGQE